MSTHLPKTSRARGRWLSPVGLAAALLTAALALPAAPQALAAPGDDATDPSLQQSVSAQEPTSSEPAVVEAGHIDVGPRVVDGQWLVQARDDSGDKPVWRDPGSTVLHVTDAALLDAPTEEAYSFMGGQAGERWYVVPQTQNPEVVWLGWNTQDPGVTELVDRGATMSIGPVSGPGKSWMFLQDGTFGEPLLLVDGQKPEPQEVWVDVNTHVHANWVFTTPGIYLAQLTFSAQTVSGETVSATSTLRFAVGSQTSTDDALSAPAPWAAQEGQGGQDASAQAAPASDASTPSAQEAAPAQTAAPSRLWYLLGLGGALVVLVAAGAIWRLRRTGAAERAEAIAQARAEALGQDGQA